MMTTEEMLKAADGYGSPDGFRPEKLCSYEVVQFSREDCQLIKDLAAKVRELQKDSDKLQALEAAGVENWDGYDDAMIRLHDGDKDE